jgi:4-diphosphocytidyl-2-C-methyl-D-erythritol kinase
VSPRHLSSVGDSAAATPPSITVRVPAKVNLHLAVGPKRPDGYHEMHTVYQAVSLYDEVTLTESTRLSVSVTGEGAGGVPEDDTNLAARAVRAIAALAGRSPKVAIAIRKGIPVAGGMAGGSADAAAALAGAERMFQAGLEPWQLQQLAGGIGSDVPFLLAGGTALGTGRGEVVSPVLARGQFHWVFALAESGLETPRVYAELDKLRSETGAGDTLASADGVLAAVRTGDVVALGRSLHNDLQAAALRLRPELGRLLAAGREAGAVGGVLSGSGPTVALLARDGDDAVEIAAELAGSGLCRTVRQATGPVAGARVIA